MNEIESLTGLDFLTTLPDDIAEHIEREISGSLWNTERKDFLDACR